MTSNEAINQWEVASRQLATAIRMYFDGGDAVSIHTLAGAAREIYEKECARTGADRMFEHIRAANPGTDKQLWNVINGARNFFKHPRASLDETIHFTDSDNKVVLFIASHDCSKLLQEAQPIEVQVFNVWFMATEFTSDVNDYDQKAATGVLRQIDAMFPGLRAAPLAEQKFRGRRLLLEAALNPQLNSLTLVDRIGISESLIQWINSQVDGIEMPTSDRTRLAAGCIDTAMEHHAAIVALMAYRLYGSALALVRPTFEAYLRAAWLHQCASSGQLDQFKRGKLELAPGAIISELEQKPSFQFGVLSKAKRASWSKMCDFTHTGAQQAIRRNKTESIEPDYDDAELIDALAFADAIGQMCVIELAHLAGDTYLAEAVLDRIRTGTGNESRSNDQLAVQPRRPSNSI